MTHRTNLNEHIDEMMFFVSQDIFSYPRTWSRNKRKPSISNQNYIKVKGLQIDLKILIKKSVTIILKYELFKY